MRILWVSMDAYGSPGGKWRNGREMGENDLSDDVVFSYFCIVVLGYFGVYIIPKWLINDS